VDRLFDGVGRIANDRFGTENLTCSVGRQIVLAQVYAVRGEGTGDIDAVVYYYPDVCRAGDLDGGFCSKLL
jgi:hypothetical protein